MSVFSGLLGATLHFDDSESLLPLQGACVTWGHKGEILSVPWDEFLMLITQEMCLVPNCLQLRNIDPVTDEAFDVARKRFHEVIEDREGFAQYYDPGRE